MSDYTRPTSCLLGCMFFGLVLTLGVLLGGAGSYLLWQETTVQNQPIVAESYGLPVTYTEPINAVNPPEQSIIITQESASVEAVNKVLPTVVTVINRSGFSSGSGTGFFVSDEGYLVTNNHVVENGSDIYIIYSEGGIVPARLIGTAPDFDLAVLHVDRFVPAIAEWGDSGVLPLGAPIIAIGSALGRYQNTVTGGILSGFNRELGGLQGLLQTDAAINHGNSGGPLINLAGQVIGINTMVVRGGPSEAVGLGFAIPSNVARNVVKQLIERGEARPPFLGIRYTPLNPLLATEQNLSITEGAFIEGVVDGTPAGQAGLQAGDVIIKISGKPVDDRNQLVSLLFEHVAGETIVVSILRNGSTFDAPLTLIERVD